MKNNIIKEILITLLMVVAVILILAVVFYQYIPSNRVIPSKVTAYQASEEVEKEIEEASTELMEQQRTYEITDADLSMYKQNDSYRPGKVDPFAASSSSATEGESTGNPTTGNASSGGQTTGQTQLPQGQEKDTNTTNNYYTASGIESNTK